MKRILAVFLSLSFLLLPGCAEYIENSDMPEIKYEAVAKLYIETLWRELNENDEVSLNLCSKSVREKIIQASEDAQAALRKREYLTKEEVAELIGPLDEYYSTRKQEYLDMQQMEVWGGETYTIDDYDPVKVLTQDTYEVVPYGNMYGRVILEDGYEYLVKLPTLYPGDYDITLNDYSLGIYKYQISLKTDIEDENIEIMIYLDVENGKVERLQESLITVLDY